MNKVLWTKLFLKCQGIDISNNIVEHDNKSAIRLEKNGRWSAGKRSKVLNVRYFFISDQIEQGNVMVEYKPTGEMLADFLTKPLQGSAFQKFRSQLMGCEDSKSNFGRK